MQTITPSELKKRSEQGPIDLIDVRTPIEFREIHVDYARNIPLDRLNPESLVTERNGNQDDPIYVICRTGSRGNMACEKFEQAGFDNVINIEGGTAACEQAQLPVTRGKKAVSLERQVRIAAGLLVLTGVILGFAIHPGFHFLAGFVGAGLTFAGITDTCAMGMLIAKMPWNQVRECQTDCQVESQASLNNAQ